MATSMCAQNCTALCNGSGTIFEMIATGDAWSSWNAAADYIGYSPWLFSLLGSTMVGLAGIFPLLVIPIEEGADLKNGDNAGTLKILLSFAVGGLLGDVFLHLLPEAWENEFSKTAEDAGHPPIPCGLWVLGGFLVFVILEKMFSTDGDLETENAPTVSVETQTDSLSANSGYEADKELENNNCITVLNHSKNGFVNSCETIESMKNINEVRQLFAANQTKNGYSKPNRYKTAGGNGLAKPPLRATEDYANGHATSEAAEHALRRLARINGLANERSRSRKEDAARALDDNDSAVGAAKSKPRHITGYLNLMANIIDNFTHGLAVGGSFLVSFRLGALTTFAILVHEIPHEVGDFAILLRSGFSRWDAARAQLLTASGGIFGALTAVLFSGGGVEARTSWILPFTAGGFLHIGMVTILPELLKESNPKESLKQLGALVFGITLMAGLTILCD